VHPHAEPAAAEEVFITLNLPSLSPQTVLAGLALLVIALAVGTGGIFALPRALSALSSAGQGRYALYMVLTALVTGVVVAYLYRNHGTLTGMVGMMAGMTLGMMVGLMVGVLVGITNGMFIGTVAAMAVAMTIGVISGCCEGLMGIMEGLMAGVMGGMMGAMLGVMMLFDRVTLFVPFMFGVFVLVMALIVIMVHRAKIGALCCDPVPPTRRSWVARYRPGGLIAAAPTTMLIVGLIVVMGLGPKSPYAGIGALPAQSSASTPATGASAAAGAASTGPAATQQVSGDPASVNGVPITQAELDQRVAINTAFLSLRGGSAQTLAAQRARIEAGVLQQMVEEELLWQQAQKAGVTATASEVDAFQTSVAGQLGSTPAALDAALRANGVSAEELRAVLERTLTVQTFIDNNVVAGAPAGQEQATFDDWHRRVRSEASIQTDPRFGRAAAGTGGYGGGGQAVAERKGNVQEVNMVASAGGYSPNVIKVQKGVPLRINITNDGSAGCSRSIVFPQQGVYELIPETGTKTVEFTPTSTGTLTFSCGMGMFRGQLLVEENPAAPSG
jgi:hypothetical protein